MRTMTVSLSDGCTLTLIEGSDFYKEVYGGLETTLDTDQINNSNLVIDETNGFKMLKNFPYAGTVNIG